MAHSLLISLMAGVASVSRLNDHYGQRAVIKVIRTAVVATDCSRLQSQNSHTQKIENVRPIQAGGGVFYPNDNLLNVFISASKKKEAP